MNLLELLKYRRAPLDSTDQSFCSGPMVNTSSFLQSLSFLRLPFVVFNAPSTSIPWLLILKYWHWFSVVFLALEAPKRLWRKIWTFGSLYATNTANNHVSGLVSCSSAFPASGGPPNAWLGKWDWISFLCSRSSALILNTYITV